MQLLLLNIITSPPKSSLRIFTMCYLIMQLFSLPSSSHNRSYFHSWHLTTQQIAANVRKNIFMLKPPFNRRVVNYDLFHRSPEKATTHTHTQFVPVDRGTFFQPNEQLLIYKQPTSAGKRKTALTMYRMHISRH